MGSDEKLTMESERVEMKGVGEMIRNEELRSESKM